MNTIQLLRDAGPEGPALTPDTRNAARAALMAEIDGARPRGLRMPSRKVRWRAGVGVVAVVSSWAAAVIIAAPDELGPMPESVELVAFEPPAFPLSLDPVPAGWDVSFSADPGGILHAAYGDEDSDDGVYVRISPEEPEQYDVTGTEDVSVNGQDAEFVRGDLVVCGGTSTECVEERIPYLHLVWERQDDQWVQFEGHGAFHDADRLLAAAETLADRPQRVPLQVSLAPAGWSVQAYKDDRILTLVDDAHEQHTLTVYLPFPEDVVPLDQLRGNVMGPVGPQVDRVVNGRPAAMVQVDVGPVDSGWHLQAQFENGTTFVVMAPPSFTQEQVLQLAETVTYHP